MAVYAVTYSRDASPRSIVPGKRYEVIEEDGPHLFRICSETGRIISCLWDGCAFLRGGTWVRIEEEEKVTLREGDYVSTEGMTEETYHAVARAFMAAGAGSAHFNRFVLKRPMSTWKLIGWGKVTGNLNGENSLRKISRHLTISQVLSATNAGNKEEDMTPCEKLGYKVGDRFEIIRHRGVRAGQTVTLHEDDGSDAPYFVDGRGQKLVIGLNDKEDEVRKVVEEEGTLTQTLRDAAEHDEKAKHHAAEHARLMQQARDMLPDGWRLVRDDEAEAEMTDPANWRVGDIVRCTAHFYSGYDMGGLYKVYAPLEEERIGVIGDDARREMRLARNFRFHHRPT